MALRLDEARTAHVLGELIERLVFKHAIDELSRLVGGRAAASLIFRIVREAMREAVAEILPKGTVETPIDALMLCYTLFNMAGEPFEYVKEADNILRVTKCPHYRFTSRNPLACAACAATKAGAIEALTGKKVMVLLEDGTRLGSPDAEIVIERTHHMPRGDPYCRFVVRPRNGKQAS